MSFSILRARWIAVLIVLVMFVGLAPEPAQAVNDRERRMYRLINKFRANNGRKKLRLSERLSKDSRKHSRRMADGGSVYHSCLSCRLQGYSYSIAGENVGAGKSVRRVFRMFKRSSGHRKNMLRKGFKRVGVGIVRSGGRVWVTVTFLG